MGKSAKIIEELKKYFPFLGEDKYFKLTSSETPNYNCIAWAYQKEDQWMQPPGGQPWYDGVTFWPNDAGKTSKIESLVSAFRVKGYEVCESGEYEEGFMKIALYWDSKTRDWTHAARQHRDGTWTSKLGKSNDIQHGTPHSLEGDLYGTIFCIMKREVEF